jgi:hypothetical protein
MHEDRRVDVVIAVFKKGKSDDWNNCSGIGVLISSYKYIQDIK